MLVKDSTTAVMENHLGRIARHYNLTMFSMCMKRPTPRNGSPLPLPVPATPLSPQSRPTSVPTIAFALQLTTPAAPALRVPSRWDALSPEVRARTPGFALDELSVDGLHPHECPTERLLGGECATPHSPGCRCRYMLLISSMVNLHLQRVRQGGGEDDGRQAATLVLSRGGDEPAALGAQKTPSGCEARRGDGSRGGNGVGAELPPLIVASHRKQHSELSMEMCWSWVRTIPPHRLNALWHSIISQ